jgi:hypothetical protein
MTSLPLLDDTYMLEIFLEGTDILTNVFLSFNFHLMSGFVNYSSTTELAF